MSGPELSPELRARLLAVVRAEKVAPRKEGRLRRLAVVAAAIALWTVVAFAVARPTLGGRSLASVAIQASLWFVVGAWATWVGVSRGGSMLGRAPAARVAVATLTPLALLGSAVAMQIGMPSGALRGAGLDAHVVCVVLTTLFALGPLVAFALLWRGTDPVAPRQAGAAIGAAAGAWGALGIEPHCGLTATWHVVLGHVLPVALLALLGAALGQRVVAIRARNG